MREQGVAPEVQQAAFREMRASDFVLEYPGNPVGGV